MSIYPCSAETAPHQRLKIISAESWVLNAYINRKHIVAVLDTRRNPSSYFVCRGLLRSLLLSFPIILPVSASTRRIFIYFTFKENSVSEQGMHGVEYQSIAADFEL